MAIGRSAFSAISEGIANAALRVAGKPTTAFEAEMDIESKRQATPKPKPKKTEPAKEKPAGISDYAPGISTKLGDAIKTQTGM